MPLDPPLHALHGPLLTEADAADDDEREDADFENFDEMQPKQAQQLELHRLQEQLRSASGFTDFMDPEVEAAFMKWFEGSICYLQVGICFVATNVLVLVRSSNDSPLHLVIVYVCGMAISGGLLLRHHQWRVLRYFDGMRDIQAIELIACALLLFTAYSRLVLDRTSREDLALRHVQRIQSNASLLGFVYVMVGMLLGTCRHDRWRTAALGTTMLLRLLDIFDGASTASKGYDYLGVVTLMVLAPLVLGFFAVQPYELIARKLWAQSESRVRALRSQLEELQGQVGTMELYRRQELVARRKIDRDRTQRQAKHNPRATIRLRNAAANATLEPVIEVDTEQRRGTRTGVTTHHSPHDGVPPE